MFSKACEYGIRALIYIAHKSTEGDKLSIKDIAKETGSPEHFIAKILQTLSKQGLVSSTKGPNGGFFLEKNAAPISVMDVIYAIDGPNPFSACVLGLRECDDKHPCPLHNNYKPIKIELLKLFSTKTIQELAISISKGNVINNFLRE
ncbi:transcriptional regulator [Solitalea longa]|uniref:Transcriptional regulator n=1 Tax=Solitalea longa TaxID=2079460 RepID=A0A2S5A322_9SPHI|nr:Rrf2 family transcriptional regulator [Solitalea longa]POY36707.1 transcriptional regulator [Solitalea longa]